MCRREFWSMGESQLFWLGHVGLEMPWMDIQLEINVGSNISLESVERLGQSWIRLPGRKCR